MWLACIPGKIYELKIWVEISQKELNSRVIWLMAMFLLMKDTIQMHKVAVMVTVKSHRERDLIWLWIEQPAGLL